MKNLTEQLTQYAYYHQDMRNVKTHFIGVPMIMLAIVSLLSRPSLALGDWNISLALVASLAATLFYVRLDVRLGLALGAALALMLVGGNRLAALPTAEWLGAGLGLFVVGWVFQFVGHYFEGKKPAFVDDLVGLLIGPLFVAVELGFLLQMRLELQAEIHRRLQHGRVTVAPQ